MDDTDSGLLAEHPRWRVLLELYQERTAEPSASPLPANEESRGPRWSPRVNALDAASGEELSLAHAQLIAHGWLHFQLEDAQMGLCYRVSPEGREALRRAKLSATSAVVTSEIVADAA